MLPAPGPPRIGGSPKGVVVLPLQERLAAGVLEPEHPRPDRPQRAQRLVAVAVGLAGEHPAQVARVEVRHGAGDRPWLDDVVAGCAALGEPALRCLAAGRPGHGWTT